jgi:hypothetical protein
MWTWVNVYAHPVTKRPTLKALVERKAGECRGLAMAMRAEAKSQGPRRRHERVLMEKWADSLDAISDGLTEAVNAGDHERLRYFIKAVAAVGLAVATGAAGGAAQSATDGMFGSEQVHDRVHTVLVGLPELEAATYEVFGVGSGVIGVGRLAENAHTAAGVGISDSVTVELTNAETGETETVTSPEPSVTVSPDPARAAAGVGETRPLEPNGD